MTQRHRAEADCLLTGQLFGELLAATRRDREIDLLSECLPLVAASIVASFDVVANDNALLAACGTRAWSLGHGRALLQRWIRGAGDDRAIRVRDILDAQCPDDGEEDARWERLVTGWRGAVEAFCVGERDRSLPRFLHYAALAQPIDTHAPASGGERGDPRALPHAQRVALMTVHSAKGLEWDAVVMVGMEEGQIPHYRSVKAAALAEEQRILYVGMTRARERLFLFSAACRHGREAGCSRFLEPLLGEAIETWRA